ncbi:hypothetical protein ACFO0N_00310 [Halobium salinum]|uniref:Uncharacterized protein n=1 Tax=Halobium salinum TaxID=1364940 RepID=A0ABD5P6A3_9EURY|nr:hypothetical protein [Halobium salinum]
MTTDDRRATRRDYEAPYPRWERFETRFTEYREEGAEESGEEGAGESREETDGSRERRDSYDSRDRERRGRRVAFIEDPDRKGAWLLSTRVVPVRR